MPTPARIVLQAEKPAELRLYDGAPCGFPSPAADYEEPPLSLDELVNVRAYSTFLVKARGDSMYPLIRDGDVLVVDRSLEASQGDVVIAVLQGDFTVKSLGYVDGAPALIPENPKQDPILLGDEPLEIWGVVTWNLHRMKRGRVS